MVQVPRINKTCNIPHFAETSGRYHQLTSYTHLCSCSNDADGSYTLPDATLSNKLCLKAAGEVVVYST